MSGKYESGTERMADSKFLVVRLKKTERGYIETVGLRETYDILGLPSTFGFAKLNELKVSGCPTPLPPFLHDYKEHELGHLAQELTKEDEDLYAEVYLELEEVVEVERRLIDDGTIAIRTHDQREINI